MKKILSVLGTISLIITLLTGMYSLYHEVIESKNPTLTVAVQKNEHSTKLSKINGLKAFYRFNGRKISDLWTMDVLVTNTGGGTIVGRGERKNLMDNDLKFQMSYPYKILDANIEPSFDESLYSTIGDSAISFKFSQWRPGETVKMVLYIEGDTAKHSEPTLFISDRQIIDGKITSVRESEGLYGADTILLKDVFKNNAIVDFLGFMAMYISWLAVLFAPVIFILGIISYVKYDKWLKKYGEIYIKEIATLKEEGKILKEYHTSKLPEEFWGLLTVEKPPLNVSAKSDEIKAIILVFFIWLGGIGGLIWTTPKFW